MKRLFAGIVAILPALGLASNDWHTFTGLNGHEMVGRVLSVDANAVLVESKTDGKRQLIELKNLSSKDVAFLKGAGGNPGSAKPDDASDNSADLGKFDRNIYPRTRDEIREGIREIQRRSKPSEVSKEVHKATQQLNIYRFLCGVPSTVEPDAEFCKGATDAALACQKNGGLSHSLGHSTDRCNLSTVGDVVASVSQYIEDGGDNNRDVRGHRAWCLNPPMGKVGFGSGGGSYSAMWCMDSSGKSKRKDGIWSYPGKGLFPLEYVHGNAWSVYGTGASGSADKIQVEVFKLPNRPDRPYHASSDIPGREIKINHISTGMGAINFEPNEPNKRGIYWVRVKAGSVNEGYLVELY